jgi:hypothetical protein
MLNGERGQVRVGDKIAMYTGQHQQFSEHICVALGRLRYPARLASELSRHLLPSGCDRERARHYSRIRRQPQESKQRWPRQTYGNDTRQLPAQPFQCGGVLL